MLPSEKRNADFIAAAPTLKPYRSEIAAIAIDPTKQKRRLDAAFHEN